MIAALGAAVEPERDLGLELEVGAVGRLVAGAEGDRDVVGGAEDVEEAAEDGGFGCLGGAAGRVQGEVGAIGVDAEVAQLQGDPLEDVGDRV